MLTLEFSLFMEFYVPLYTLITKQIAIPIKLLQIWIDMKCVMIKISFIWNDIPKNMEVLYFSSKIVPINSKWFNIIQTKFPIFKSILHMHNSSSLNKQYFCLVTDMTGYWCCINLLVLLDSWIHKNTKFWHRFHHL